MCIRHAQGENKAETICSQSVGIAQGPPATRFPFMNGKLIRLAERRERLIAQAAAQRVALAHSLEPWRTPLALADQGLAVLRYIKRNPAWIVGGVVLLAALRPGSAGKWLRRSWVTWQIIQKLRAN